MRTRKDQRHMYDCQHITKCGSRKTPFQSEMLTAAASHCRFTGPDSQLCGRTYLTASCGHVLTKTFVTDVATCNPPRPSVSEQASPHSALQEAYWLLVCPSSDPLRLLFSLLLIGQKTSSLAVASGTLGNYGCFGFGMDCGIQHVVLSWHRFCHPCDLGSQRWYFRHH